MLKSRIQKIINYTLIVSLISCQNKDKDHFDIVIQNGKIIDLETGDIFEQDFFITKGRIQKIAESGSKIDFDAKKVINAKEKYILPGFWDNHVHFRGGDSLINANKNFLKLFIANGITTVRDAGGDLTSSIMDWKKKIVNGKLEGPMIFTSGPKIDGPRATWAGSLEVENDTDIDIALDILQTIPSDYVKLYDSRISGENYIETIKRAKKRGLITSGHMPFTVNLEETVNAGIDGIEHLYYIMKGCSTQEYEITKLLVNKEIGFWQAMPLLMQTYADSTARKTFKHLKQNDVYVIPTLHIGKTLSYLDEIDHSKDEYLKYIHHGILKTYEGRIKRAANSSEKTKQDRKLLDSFFGELVKLLNDEGVNLLAGSDSGAYNSFTYPGISLHKELQEMVNNGMSSLEALRTSAPNGSKFLKQDSNSGSLEIGKISDIVILETNPLDDISNTQKIFAVIKGNEVYDKNKLKMLLDSAIETKN